MGSVGCSDEILRIKYVLVALRDVGDRHRIDVMDVDSVVHLVTIDSQITAVISGDDVVTNKTPFS